MKKIYLLLFSLFTLGISQSEAAHLVGGELSYECIGPDQYLITLKIYRDCNSTGAPFDPSAPISIWNSYGFLEDNIFMDFPDQGSDTLELINLNPCLIDTPDVCVEAAIYQEILVLPQTVIGDYIIAYQRCCRNNTISNIDDPGGTGSTYWATIPSDTTVTCNSSPSFDNFPPIVICANQPVVFDHSATDIDGDSLVYSMCDPFEGSDTFDPAPNPTTPPPFANVTWLTPYGTDNQVGGFPQLGIDSSTGQLVGYPDTPGQFVVGVCVDEYRDGVFLNTTIRDFQFNVTACGIDEIAEAEAEVDGVIVAEPEGCAPFEVEFYNIAAPFADSFWDFGDMSSTDVDQPTHTFTEPGTYIVTLTALDTSSCVEIDSSFIQVNVLPCIVCPDTLIVSGPSEGCDSETISLQINLAADSISTIICTGPDGNPEDPNNIILSNLSCVPQDVTYTVTSTCLDDPSDILTETVTVTVYPSDISPFLSESVTDCSVELVIDSDCVDYIEASPGIVVMPGESGSLDITATYLATDLCASDYTVNLSYDCPDCSIDSFTATVLECNGSDFMVEIDITGDDLSSTFTLSGASGTIGTFNYSDLPITIGPYFGDEVTIYSITVADDADSNCVSNVSFGPVDCLPCSINANLISTYCVGTEYYVDIDVSSSNSSAEFTVDGFGSFLYTDSPVSIGPFTSSEIDMNSLVISDSIESDCTASLDVGPLGCYVCDLDNVEVYAVCTSEDSFNVYVSFTGSNTYTISDGSSSETGMLSGENILLGAYASNTDVIITITDEQADNCEYIAEPVSGDCGCDSEAGTIMVSNMNVCPGDISVTDADDFLLEPGQSVYYLYHNQPLVDGANLPDLVSDVYTTGSFLMNNGTAVPCGTTVYVTAIGAYENPEMIGFPDYSDYCLTISNTIPINFLCPIVITVDETCDKTNGEFTYTFMVSGGLPQLISGETYSISGDYFTGSAGLSGSVVVGPIPDLSSYTVTATDGNGCESSITHDVECEKVPIELISFNGSALNEGNLLEWETASEIENDYFTLYSSNDGTSYTELVKVNGAGNSFSVLKYDHLDATSESGTTYYKLAQTDFDGTYTVVSIISVRRENHSEEMYISQIYPLPAITEINVSISVPKSDSYSINIIDISGKSLIAETKNLKRGNTFFTINIESLSSGAYFIELLNNESIISERFIVN